MFHIRSEKQRVIHNNTEVVEFTIGKNDGKVYVCEPLEADLLEASLDVISDHYQENQQPFFARAIDRIYGDVSKGEFDNIIN